MHDESVGGTVGGDRLSASEGEALLVPLELSDGVGGQEASFKDPGQDGQGRTPGQRPAVQ